MNIYSHPQTHMCARTCKRSNVHIHTHPHIQTHGHMHTGIHLFELSKVVPVSQEKDINSIVGVDISTELLSAPLHLVG